MFSGTFKFMFDVINTIIDQTRSQNRIIEDAIANPLKVMVSQVTGGIWRGDGADKFVQEMTQEVIPQLLYIMNLNDGYASVLERSVEHMQQAEQQATDATQTLLTIVNEID